MGKDLGKRTRKKKSLDEDFVDASLPHDDGSSEEKPSKQRKSKLLQEGFTPSERMDEENSNNQPSYAADSIEQAYSEREVISSTELNGQQHNATGTTNNPTNSFTITGESNLNTVVTQPTEDSWPLLPVKCTIVGKGAAVPKSTPVASSQVDQSRATLEGTLPSASKRRFKASKTSGSSSRIDTTSTPEEQVTIQIQAPLLASPTRSTISPSTSTPLTVESHIPTTSIAVADDSSDIKTNDSEFISNMEGLQMQFKRSRDQAFNTQFPKVLYTLTWKHKYDVKLISNQAIFKDVTQRVLSSLLTIDLVMGRNLSTPYYDHTRVRVRASSSSSEQTKKRKTHRKPEDSETVSLTTVTKESDNAIIIRFGINRTFCSKRFNYAPFRLKLDYTGSSPFKIYSPSFHTFAKKLNNFTVKNVNEILKKNGDQLLPNCESDDENQPTIVTGQEPVVRVLPEYIEKVTAAEEELRAKSNEEEPSGAEGSGGDGNTIPATTVIKKKDENLAEDASLLLSLGGF